MEHKMENKNNFKIMIVDDNKEFVKLLNMYINTQKDMTALEPLYDGTNAVSAIKQSKPDVLLLDVVMPEKDGLTVLEELNDEVGMDKPTIIMMSAIGQEKITQKAISLGATYYVVKPFDIEATRGVDFKDADGMQRPLGILILAIRWLFVEQDITYWNTSGRSMLMNCLLGEGLASVES